MKRETEELFEKESAGRRELSRIKSIPIESERPDTDIQIDPLLLHKLNMCMITQSVLAIEGPPGVGKTAGIIAAVKYMGWTGDVVLASLRDYQDVIGWPLPSDNPMKIGEQYFRQVEYAPPPFVLRAARAGINKRPHILVLDELTLAQPAQTALFLRILNEGVAGDVEFDRRYVGFVVLYNPSSMVTTAQDLSEAMDGRLSVYKMGDFDSSSRVFTDNKLRESWLKFFPSYWGKPPEIWFGNEKLDQDCWTWARAATAGFIKSSGPDTFYTLTKPGVSRGVDPRRWDKFSRKLAYARQIGKSPDDVLDDLFADVGHKAAEAVAWLGSHDLRDPEEIIAEEIEAFNGKSKEASWKRSKPSPFQCPEDGSAAYAQLAAISTCVEAKLTPERGVAAWRIAKAAAEAGKIDLAAAVFSRFMFKYAEEFNKDKVPSVSVEMKPFKPFMELLGKEIKGHQ